MRKFSLSKLEKLVATTEKKANKSARVASNWAKYSFKSKSAKPKQELSESLNTPPSALQLPRECCRPLRLEQAPSTGSICVSPRWSRQFQRERNWVPRFALVCRYKRIRRSRLPA
jgi:hypothetical protein